MENLILHWKEAINVARQRSKSPEYHRMFEPLTKGPSVRAAFFTEMATLISDLGLSNPHEKSALSLEPTHPLLSRDMAKAFNNLGLHSGLSATYSKNKLSLLSLRMLDRYSPSSTAEYLLSGPFRAPLYLLDPLYGFVFISLNGRISNHCLAIDIWSSHLSSMPSELAANFWKNRADNMLSGGAFAGRLLFQNIIPSESDPLKLAIAPELVVDSERQLLDLVDRLHSSATKLPGVQLWFRGQSRDYLTPDRVQIAMKGIAPYSNIRESDLTPSLYRKYDETLDNLQHYEQMILELAEWVHGAKQLIPSGKQNAHKAPIGVARTNQQGITSYQRGLLLQQYGAPSAYLDVTSDPLIAAWFATHKCEMLSPGMMTFRDYAWNNPSPECWPTVYVFPLVDGLHPLMKLEAIMAGSNALRPSRQKCGLLGGAGNLARNYCARYLGLKIRLRPGFELSNKIGANHLFPPSSEDGALRSLKDLGLGEPSRRLPLTELAMP